MIADAMVLCTFTKKAIEELLVFENRQRIKHLVEWLFKSLKLDFVDAKGKRKQYIDKSISTMLALIFKSEMFEQVHELIKNFFNGAKIDVTDLSLNESE
jgi:hypothetical protein